MRKTLLTILAFFITGAFCFILLPPKNALAAPLFINTDKEFYATDHSIDEDLYLLGHNIEINNSVKGNVFVVGKNITINNDIDGNIYAMGESINIKSKIAGDIIVVAGSLSVSDQVSGSIYTISETTKIESNVLGSLGFIGDTLYLPITGEVEKSVYGILSKLNLDGKVGKDLVIYHSRDAVLNINGKINNNFVYQTENRPNVTDTAYIGGTTEKKELSSDEFNGYASKKVLFWQKVMSFIVLFTMGLIMTKLFPNYFNRAFSNNYFQNVLGKLIKGIIGIVLMLVAIVLLFVTVIGIPYALSIIVTLSIIYLYVGLVPLAIFISSKLIPQQSRAMMLFIGSLIVIALGLNQTIGSLISLIMFILFIGDIITMYLNRKNAI